MILRQFDRAFVFVATIATFATTGLLASATNFIDPLFSVSVTPNIQYGNNVDGAGNEITLRLDIYEPSGVGLPAQLPAIVLMHGGFFRDGNKKNANIVALANDFASRGYVAVSIDYRKLSLLPPPPGVPMVLEREPFWLAGQLAGWGVTRKQYYDTIAAAVGDQAMAVNWLADNAATYDINPDWIAVGGFSAGAVSSLLLSVGAVDGVEADVRCVFSMAGGLFGQETFIDARDPGVYIIHGNSDPIVPYADFPDFLQPALTDAGVPLASRIVATDHNFSSLHAALLSEPDPVFEFVKNQLGATDDHDDFFAWITGFEVGGLSGFADDYDKDGLVNGLENFFGTNPGVPNANNGVVSIEDTSIRYQHPHSATPASDVSSNYEWSTDLKAYHPSGATVGTTTVTLTPITEDPSVGTTTVVATTTGTRPKRLFVRLRVTQNTAILDP